MSNEALVVEIADSGNGKTDEQLASLRQLTLVIYILYAFAWVTGLTAIVAIVINYVKREDAAGTLYESHFTWQIRTFWWSIVWGVVGVITIWVGIGFVVFFVLFIWMIYRLVKGLLYWNDRKPLPVQ
ncbi:hypothetical protein PY257_05970 [Ramlibacter sp. H39-3-26]|uniref:DUF4870 family protein n=1 Tax=Curvibacter soli TaxID=3031331 RepID=UPI0023DB8F06|nr:hypothetical protein [Ramlibacter sp. H39-3-26]MDF1484735.1 hypothetical protein [Ramlibacter sp. H39-3-26]